MATQNMVREAIERSGRLPATGPVLAAPQRPKHSRPPKAVGAQEKRKLENRQVDLQQPGASDDGRELMKRRACIRATAVKAPRNMP